MPLPPVTRFSAVDTKASPTNKNNGLYVPPLNTAQIAAIPAETKLNGGIWYNNDAGQLEAVVQNKVQPIQVGAGGQGDVVGPNGAIQNNIAIFGDKTGRLIADSGVSIAQVPNAAALLRFSNSLETPNVDVNEIGNLGHIRFINDVCSIYVDTLTSIRFFPYDAGKNSQVCSVFTSETGAGGTSTSQSALLEINSDSGALLLSRLTTTERDNLVTPVGGMMLFNKTLNEFQLHNGINWRSMPLYNPDGTLTVEDPIDLKDAATKNYVDSAIAVPAAAKFIIQTANASVPNSQVLGALTTGLLKNTTTTGVLTIGVAGTDYYSPGNPTRILNSATNFFIGTNAGNTTLTGGNNLGVGDNALTALTTGTNNLAIGINTLTALTNATDNLAIGATALQNNTANKNLAIGEGALKSNTTGTNNLSIGFNSQSANLTGSNNTSLGLQALNANTASDNTALGYSVLSSNTLGTNNVGIGSQVLQNNTTGANNIALGFQSLQLNVLGSSNVACGGKSLQNNTADNNSAFGHQSLSSNTTGANNTAFGSNSGALRTIYNNCTFFGFGADTSINNLTNAVAIGYQASVGANNCMVLGGSGANQLSVGIGVTPNAQLQLPTIHANRKIVLYETANNDNEVIGLGTAAGTFRFQIDASTSNYIFYAASLFNPTISSTELMRLTGGGFLGIGTAVPNAPLQFANTFVNRKIVLYEAANNDNQIIGLGTGTITLGRALRYQVDSFLSDHIWYAAQNSTTSNELMRLTGGGFLGLGVTPNAQLQLPTIHANRKIVLYQTANNDNEVIGLGTAAGTFRFQIDASTSNYIFYAASVATPSSTSTELMRLAGNGTLYAKQSYASYNATGTASTVTSATPGTYVNLNPNTNGSQTNTNNFTISTGFSAITITWNNAFVPSTGMSIIVSFAATQSGLAGEITTFSVFKNGFASGTRLTSKTYDLKSSSASPTVVLNVISNITATSDYFTLAVSHSIASRTVVIGDLNVTISST